MKLSEREQEFIREQVEKLPPIEKAVMHWLFWEGVSLRGIAIRLKKRVAEIKTIRDLVLGRIKKEYLEEFEKPKSLTF